MNTKIHNVQTTIMLSKDTSGLMFQYGIGGNQDHPQILRGSILVRGSKTSPQSCLLIVLFRPLQGSQGDPRYHRCACLHD